MTINWTSFFLGGGIFLIVGANVGIVMAALCAAAKRGDDDE